MKIKIFPLGIIIAMLVGFTATGCHKKAGTGVSGEPPKTLEEGMAQVQALVATASPMVQSNYYQVVSYGVRYGNFAAASQGLQDMATDPGLTAGQKQLINSVNDLVKQKAGGGTTP